MKVTEYQYEYGLYPKFDIPIFKRQCDIFEKAIKGLKKEDMLIDVDWSQIQIYILDGKKITVVNEQSFGEVYVKSQIDLEALGFKLSSIGLGKAKLLLEDTKDMKVTEYQYEYGLYPEYDEHHFKRQCESLEKQLKGLKKGKLLIDVDGSQIQLYTLDGKEIQVLNDKDFGEVCVKSQIDLEALGLRMHEIDK